MRPTETDDDSATSEFVCVLAAVPRLASSPSVAVGRRVRLFRPRLFVICVFVCLCANVLLNQLPRTRFRRVSLKYDDLPERR